MEEIVAQLHEVSARARSAEPREVESLLCEMEAPRIVAALREARRRGLAFDGAARALAREMRLAAREAAATGRMLSMLRGRMALGIGIAALVHTFVMKSLDPRAATAAAAIAMCVHAFARRRTPRIWIHDEAAASTWLLDYLGITTEATRSMSLREARLGVSMEREKRALLRDLARKRRGEARLAGERLMDLLPLLELIGIGAPAALLLAAPVLTKAALALTVSTL